MRIVDPKYPHARKCCTTTPRALRLLGQPALHAESISHSARSLNNFSLVDDVIESPFPFHLTKGKKLLRLIRFQI